MPSFSFTAPIISAEQEMREVNELADEERERIRMDVHGSDVSFEQPVGISVDADDSMTHPPGQREREVCSIGGVAYEAFQREMLKIVDKDKKDFLEAMRVAPNLVATESNPSLFVDRSPSPAVRRKRHNTFTCCQPLMHSLMPHSFLVCF